jgi:hypothetical protein
MLTGNLRSREGLHRMLAPEVLSLRVRSQRRLGSSGGIAQSKTTHRQHEGLPYGQSAAHPRWDEPAATIERESQRMPSPVRQATFAINNRVRVGVMGGLAVELIALAAPYDSGQPFRDKYRRISFYLVRGAIALTGDLLALIDNVTNFPAALQIGASTPVLLAALSTVRSGNGGNPAGGGDRAGGGNPV